MNARSGKRCRIGVTIGDINGIGPEVALKAVYKKRWPTGYAFIFIGHAGLLSEQAQQFGFPRPKPWKPGEPIAPSRKMLVWDPGPKERLSWNPGHIDPRAAEYAANWIRCGVEAHVTGALNALVTAPICKEGFRKAGLSWPGHTEMLAERTGRQRYAMMLLNPDLRVVIATRHIPLKNVARTLTRSIVLESIELTAEALKWLGEKKNHIAVCGLNPHAGDGGTLGREEIDIITPAIRQARRRKWPVFGPLPADSVFYQALRGDYAAVVAMYHDQGLAPFKMLAFENGVNLTLGLPIVRTSPDHGTGLDIAGRGVADPSSMAAAIRLAGRLASRRNPWASS